MAMSRAVRRSAGGGAPPRRAALDRPWHGYSRFVAVMKLVLPITAGAVIALLISWPQLHDAPERFRVAAAVLVAGAGGGQQLVNARYAGTDRNNNPYTLTAEALIQNEADGDVVSLRKPEADFTTAGGAWVAVSAPRGSFARKTETMSLDGGVSLFHDAGYEIRTASAAIDFRQSVASGEAPVVGHGPAARLEAAGFRILRDGGRISFTGPARVVLYERPAELSR